MISADQIRVPSSICCVDVSLPNCVQELTEAALPSLALQGVPRFVMVIGRRQHNCKEAFQR